MLADQHCYTALIGDIEVLEKETHFWSLEAGFFGDTFRAGDHIANEYGFDEAQEIVPVRKGARIDRCRCHSGHDTKN